MGSLKTLALAVALSLPMAQAALAADVPGVPQMTDSEDLEFGSNWYLRGDIGYKVASHKKDMLANDIFGDIEPTQAMNNKWTGGLGFGYNFGQFRMDATVDYYGKNYDTASTSYACGNGASCSLVETPNGDALTLMLNAYYDIGTWDGITPYIGAGIGSYGQIGHTTGTARCVTVTQGCLAPFPAEGGDVDIAFDKSNWHLAYALMAGASYDLTSNLAIDLGYRFLGIQDGDTEIRYRNGIAETKQSDHFNHEIRLGFRYKID